MNINNIFRTPKLAEAEEIELHRIFTAPVVQKYLVILGQEDSKELLTLGALDMPPEQLANRHNYISGKLAVVSTLLSISNPEE